MYEDLLFPGVMRDNWQMMECERIALTGILARLLPRGALEIGVYHGGSFSLTAQFATHIIGIDSDPAVRTRFTLPQNGELLIGHSQKMIPRALARFEKLGLPLQYVLIDAEHSAQGVRRDIGLVLQYRPTAPMIMLIHDSGNAGCRAGILSVDWGSCPYVHAVQCDFVPGQIVEHSVRDGCGQVWGGLALAYFEPQPRNGTLVPAEGSATMIRAAHFVARDLTVLKGHSTAAAH